MLMFELIHTAIFLIIGLTLMIKCHCCADPCTNCYTGTTSPETIQVDISGVANGSCSSCASFDGTYILTRSGVNPCIWVYTFSPSVCLFNGLWVELTATYVQVVYVQTGLRRILWRNTVAGYNECDWASYNVPPFSVPFGECNIAASTCTITAL